jgi:uncharacterized membrane protein YbhN (UPF0104 family)
MARLPARDHASLLGLAVGRHVVLLFGMGLCARAVGIDADWSTLAWVRALVALATLLPVSVSGLGLREAGFAVLLEPYGVPVAQAVALSLLVFSQVLFLAALGAIVEARSGPALRLRAAKSVAER